MYKAFLAKFKQKSEPSKPKDDHSGVKPDIDEQVKEIWKVIDSQCVSDNDEKGTLTIKAQNKLKSTDWKIVRLFVSSTFADFFNEREVLVKQVFPELREWCQERNLKLIECDLRWGVPRDTPSEQTVLICLEEIDKCIQVSDGLPLFIGLIGDRYGWMPLKEEICSEVRDGYKWVDGTSITCMEILHGAYRTKNPNAAFFFRNPSVYTDIPQSHKSNFVDKNPLTLQHHKVLKEKLVEAFPYQTYHYEPKFKQLSDPVYGKERQVVLEGFDDFAKDALDFFKCAILRIHPKQEYEKIDPALQEQETQWLYIQDKGNGLIGRQAEKEILLNFLINGVEEHFEVTEASESQLRALDEWDISEDDKPLCAVEAPSGWGKTTLISSVVQDIVNNQTEYKVFYHMVGSTPGSVQIQNLLQRLLSALGSGQNDNEEETKEVRKLEDLKCSLKRALCEFRNRKSDKLIIILDSLDTLSNCSTLDHLSWLPPVMPPNIRCLVSTNQHLPTTCRLFEHPTLKLSLKTMTQKELEEIATQYLGNFSKKLHPTQLTSLMTKTKVDNPLWLTMMVEELRIFGSFQEMDQRIDELPTSLYEFLIQVFDRLIQEDGPKNLIKKVLCMVTCSRFGIPSDYVLQVLGDAKTKEPIALLEWLQIKRSLKPYLRTSGFLEEMVTFSHDAVRQAVIDHYLANTSDVIHWNTILADYYQVWCDKPREKVHNLLYHLKNARLHQRMVQFMRTDRDSVFHFPDFLRSNYLKDCRCRSLADSMIPGTTPVMICFSCGLRPHGFSNGSGWSNKTSCVICGALCLSGPKVLARACSKHGQVRGKEMVKCILCTFAVTTASNAKHPAPSQVMLCHHCGFGNGGRTCAILSCDNRLC